MSDLDGLVASVKDKFNELIQKPKMTEKLLGKPPFRFLHDTISAVTATTGFASGLYNDQELDSNAIADKQQKIDYLQKIINCVGICKGFPVQVSPLKIVAGQEPENTNQFLLYLAECATDQGLDHSAAVRRVLDGESPTAGAPIPRKSSNRSQATDLGEAKSSRQDDISDSKGGGGRDDFKRPVDVDAEIGLVAQQPERGKSRGGTRGSNPARSNQDMGLSRSSAIPNLEAEIEKCDGTEAKTQEMLQPLFQKPQLTEKLLQKPPFRFLFDIVMAVMKGTNFGQHLYSAEEMDFNNINDKEKKIHFLEKIIKVIGSSLNTIVEAKPVKIIAGADPQNTNSMLQLLAVAAKNVPNSNSQVKAVLDELGGGNPAAVASSSGGGSTQKTDTARSSDFSAAEPKHGAPRVSDKAKVVESQKPDVDLSAPRREITRQEEDDSKSSQHHGSAGDDAEGGGGDGENKRSARPTTARRRPPKVKEEEAAAAAGAKVSVAKKAEGIMVDGQNDDEDDIVEEEKRLADDVKNTRGASDNQSKLVQDIISRQVEQESAKMTTDSVNPDDAKAADDENKGGIRFKKKVSSDKKIAQPGTAAAMANSSSTIKAKYSSAEIDRIRNSIQLLVQNTGPLGSCMDFIQEDVSLMTSELHKWEEECRTYDAILDQEKRKTQETLMPLQQQLSDVEEQITDQLMKISSIKAAITRNDENILKALGHISTV